MRPFFLAATARRNPKNPCRNMLVFFDTSKGLKHDALDAFYSGTRKSLWDANHLIRPRLSMTRASLWATSTSPEPTDIHRATQHMDRHVPLHQEDLPTPRRTAGGRFLKPASYVRILGGAEIKGDPLPRRLHKLPRALYLQAPSFPAP